jgi:membrane protein
MPSIQNPVRLIYDKLNLRTGGGLSIILHSISYFTENRGSEAAAVVSYYSLFSIFPLLIFIIAGLSMVLGVQTAQEQVAAQIQKIIPISTEYITQNIESVLRQRTSFSLIGLAGLFWAATGMFNTLVLNINRAWPQANPRNILQNRLVAILLVSSMAAAIFISLTFTTIIDLLPLERLPYWEATSPNIKVPTQFLTQYGPFLLRFIVIWIFYWLIPNTKVHLLPALLGAFSTTVLWEISTNIFTWYLSSGFISYEIVYGSLGRIVALLVWIYISSWLLIFGAYLTAAIAILTNGRPYQEFKAANNRT